MPRPSFPIPVRRKHFPEGERGAFRREKCLNLIQTLHKSRKKNYCQTPAFGLNMLKVAPVSVRG